MPFGSVNFEAGVDANGERYIWLPRAVVDRLRYLRAPGESYSDAMPAGRRRWKRDRRMRPMIWPGVIAIVIIACITPALADPPIARRGRASARALAPTAT
jgi:hypothetical protein